MADDIADKRVRALNLRKAGATYDQIAQQVGYAARSGAYKAVVQALRDADQDTVTESHKLDGQRLDQILMALWPKAMKGDGEAVDRILRVIELRGAPQPVERRGKVEASVARDIERLPEELRISGLAATALELARNIDNGVSPATCARELRAAMTYLAEQAVKDQIPATAVKEGGIADLAARIAARRNATAG